MFVTKPGAGHIRYDNYKNDLGYQVMRFWIYDPGGAAWVVYHEEVLEREGHIVGALEEAERLAWSYYPWVFDWRGSSGTAMPWLEEEVRAIRKREALHEIRDDELPASSFEGVAL